MDLFGKDGIMTQIFSANDQKWKSHKVNDKAKHAFMVNRMFSINFPVQAQAMNINGFNPYATIETWRVIAKQVKRAPGWLFTKMTKAKVVKKKGKEYIPSDEVIKMYMDRNECSQQQFDDAMKFNKVELLAYLQKIEKQLEVYDRH